MSDSVYKFTFNADGSVRIDASKAAGGEAQILKELGGLATDLGSSLKVEKHRPGIVHHEKSGILIKIGGKE